MSFLSARNNIFLAPMAGITDPAFRQIAIEMGAGLTYTEMASSKGIQYGSSRTKEIVSPAQNEDVFGIQLFGNDPDAIKISIQELLEAYPERIALFDINMGCPDRGVEKSGGGAALIKDPARAKQIIRSLKKGTARLPVSVKTRLGYSKTAELETWITALLEEQLTALTVHLRTRAEMSDVPAHWELAPQIVALRDRISPKTVLLGNGDVLSLEDARAKTKESGMDGVMVGAGVFGNPWFFSGRTPDVQERLEYLVAHTELFEKLYRSNDPKPISQGGRIKNFDIMKKHYKSYTSGEKELRMRLMEAENAAEVREIVQDFLKKS